MKRERTRSTRRGVVEIRVWDSQDWSARRQPPMLRTPMHLAPPDALGRCEPGSQDGCGFRRAQGDHAQKKGANMPPAAFLQTPKVGGRTENPRQTGFSVDWHQAGAVKRTDFARAPQFERIEL